MSGVIKFFNNEKNFGFITAEDGTEYFVHGSDILDDSIWPETGSKCQFEIGTNRRGPCATKVRVL